MSTPIATFAGIGANFDAETLITNMVTAEKAPETAMQTHQTDLKSQISTLGSIASGLQSLGTAATALSTTDDVQSISATSANSSIFTATAAATATAGTYNISVSALASAQTSVSKGFATDDAGVAGSGTLTLSVGGKTPPYSVDYGSNDTLASIAASINQQAGGEINASVIYDGSNYRLLVTGTASGTANAITFGDSSNTFKMTTPQPATDASFSINGVNMTRSSNNISDAIPGVTFNLQSTTPTGGAATQLTVGTDSSALTTKLQALVAAYNSVASVVTSQLSYNGTTMGEDTLFGDSTIQGLEQQMGGLFATSITTSTGGSISAGDLGLSLNTDGTITLDTTKLSQTLTSNPAAAQQLLVGTDGTNGLAAQINSMVNQYTQYGTGALVTEQA
ncbi:MAG TPA: flagellar filament capping protein FliD, partial [Polyangia bacterium]|nr:flagellar filament capping protein FliD [Polyangia bacterium]